MAKQPSKGTCLLCKRSFSKSGMTRHLRSCLEKQAAGPTSDKARARRARIFHIVVQGRYLPIYWLHIEVRADAALDDLDAFLRDIWLECCDHLSGFKIDGESYDVDEPDMFAGPSLAIRSGGMNVRLAAVLRPEMEFYHDYDFGSTTYLTLRVAGQRQGVLKRGEVRILARNHPPEIPCGACGKPATQVCAFCGYGPERWVCGDCAPEHECGDEGLLPVVNSPRVGVCGYTGS